MKTFMKVLNTQRKSFSQAISPQKRKLCASLPDFSDITLLIHIEPNILISSVKGSKNQIYILDCMDFMNMHAFHDCSLLIKVFLYVVEQFHLH